MSTVPFSDLGRAAYCHRQLYYARRDDDRGPPPAVGDRIRLASRYGELRRADDPTLAGLPIDLPPAAYRDRLDDLARRDDWPALRDPVATRVRLTGRDCRGVAHKLVADRGSTAGAGRRTERAVADGGSGEGGPGDLRSGGRADGGGVDAGRADGGHAGDDDTPVVPSLVSPGTPPERGVWTPQRVKAVAAAKALAWERGRRVERAYVEYPAVGVVRTVRLTTRNRDRYRRVLRAVRTSEGVPPRTDDRGKCSACAYAEECGVRSRSLKSLLGL